MTDVRKDPLRQLELVSSQSECLIFEVGLRLLKSDARRLTGCRRPSRSPCKKMEDLTW